METRGDSGQRGGFPMGQFRVFLRENWVPLGLSSSYQFAVEKAAEKGIKPDTDTSGRSAYSAEKAKQSRVTGSRSSSKAKRRGAEIDLNSAPLLKELLVALTEFGEAGQRVRVASQQIQQQLSAKDQRIAQLEEEIENLKQSIAKDRADARIYRSMMAVAAKERGVQNSTPMMDVSRQ